MDNRLIIWKHKINGQVILIVHSFIRELWSLKTSTRDVTVMLKSDVLLLSSFSWRSVSKLAWNLQFHAFLEGKDHSNGILFFQFSVICSTLLFHFEWHWIDDTNNNILLPIIFFVFLKNEFHFFTQVPNWPQIVKSADRQMDNTFSLYTGSICLSCWLLSQHFKD